MRLAPRRGATVRIIFQYLYRQNEFIATTFWTEFYLRWSVVGHGLELRVEVEEQVDKATINNKHKPIIIGPRYSRECSSRVARHPALERIIDDIRVTSADVAVVHDLAEAVTIQVHGGDVGLANVEEVWAETSNQPLVEDLEDGTGDCYE